MNTGRVNNASDKTGLRHQRMRVRMTAQETKEQLLRGIKVWNEWRANEESPLVPILAGLRLPGADLRGADLRAVNFNATILTGADLSGADLYGADLTSASLDYAKLDGAHMGFNMIVDVDFTGVVGLETIRHSRPSEVSINTIYKSGGSIPEEFLLGCGVPESFIAQIPALISAVQPIQFNSCFISYSTKDEEFVRRLHARMRQAALRVWFAPEDVKGGRKLLDQINRAIQVHDRVLLVLSENSMKSKWVELEIRRARNVERTDRRQKLFPIRLVSYEKLLQWQCVDSTTGEDLAEEVRGYFIPDFSNWKGQDDFEREFGKLYEALKAQV